MSWVASVLVPQGVSPNIIEDLESNYHSLKSLYQKAVQLKDLLPEKDSSSISIFLEDFKNYVGNFKSQENRSGLLLQEIAIKFKYMESTLDPADPILREKLLKEQAEDLRKLVRELETKINGIKADPVMFTKEKADDLFKLIQVLKEKYSPIPDSIEDAYATQKAKEAKTSQVDQLNHRKRILETQMQKVKDDKQSKDFSLRMTEGEIRDLNQKLERVKNASNKVIHYIFLVDISKRDEGKEILKEVNSNIAALIAAKGSEGDVFSLLTFDKEARVLAERLPITKDARFYLRDRQPQSQKNYFKTGLDKVSELLQNSKNKEDTPVLALYTDGMRWYFEAETEDFESDSGEGFGAFIWNSCNRIVNRLKSFWKKWFLKPIQESEIQDVKNLLADFSERFSSRNLTVFVSGTTSQNQEILKNFAKELNENKIAFQMTIGEKYEYFNLARATRVSSQICKPLSIVEKDPEEMEIFAEDALKNLERKRLLKERDDLEKKVNELLSRRDPIESEIKTLLVEIDKRQSEISFTENKIRDLNEEIRLLNEMRFEQEQMKKEREKIEGKSAVIRSHLENLEQLTKTVQARDHNILAIFEHVTTYCKNFSMSLEEALRKNETSNFDLLIAFYKDQLRLSGTDLENVEKICQFWFGDSSEKSMAKNFFIMINPRDLIDNDLEMERAGFESLDDLKEEYQEFYWSLKRKFSTYKMDQKLKTMNSQKSDIKALFSQDFKKLMEKLNERIYMMY